MRACILSKPRSSTLNLLTILFSRSYLKKVHQRLHLHITRGFILCCGGRGDIDSATPEQISDLTRLCQSQSACLGVYPITTREPVPDKVVALPTLPNPNFPLKVFTHCPECNSEDLVIRTSVHKVSRSKHASPYCSNVFLLLI